MKTILYLMAMILFVSNASAWAQSGTLPNDLSITVNTTEGLKAVIDGKDFRFVIVDVGDESAYERGHIPKPRCMGNTITAPSFIGQV